MALAPKNIAILHHSAQFVATDLYAEKAHANAAPTLSVNYWFRIKQATASISAAIIHRFEHRAANTGGGSTLENAQVWWQ
jgi:hypothetical protein